MSKKIVLLGPMYPYRGGIAHFSEALCRELRGRGYEVIPVTFSRQYPELFFPGKTQYEPEDRPRPDAPARLLDSVNPLTWTRTARHIIRLQPDVLIFKYWMPFFAPALGCIVRRLRRRGIPSVAVIHNALPHERRPGDAALTRYALSACRGLIVMAESVERDLQALGITVPVRRAPHPVYDLFGAPAMKAAAREALGLPPDAPVALSFGFVRRYKGLHVLLNALPQAVRAFPDLRLVVAGEFYDEAGSYREQIRQNGLESHVLLHDRYVPNEQVAQYFAAADVVVQPYVSATQSGVAQIAYHFERPLIVTDVGGLAEIVPHDQAGLVVPPEDPGALASALIRFFRDGLSERLAAGVKEEKKKYSWDRLYEAVETFL